MEELEERSIGDGERHKNSVLIAGGFFAVAAPLVLHLGTWLFVFPSPSATALNLVWFLTLLCTGIGFICGSYSLFRRHWISGSLLIVASFVLLVVGVFLYSGLFLLYFGADPS